MAFGASAGDKNLGLGCARSALGQSILQHSGSYSSDSD